MGWPNIRRILIVALSGTLVLGLAAPSLAETARQRAVRTGREATREIARLQRDLARAERSRLRQIPLTGALLARIGPRLDENRLAAIRARGARAEADRDEAFQELTRRTRARIAALRARRAALGWWLGTTGVFEVCPVPGFADILDDYGEIVRVPDAPVHVHRGVDVLAPTWAPIRAPFDGSAWGGRSRYGGVEVRLRGTPGYLYVAHLVAFGRLGWVQAGDVIGYVGATGDATAPHAHLEWQPGSGGIVDPYPYLVAACEQV